MIKAGIRQQYEELTAEVLRRQALAKGLRNAVKGDTPATSSTSS